MCVKSDELRLAALERTQARLRAQIAALRAQQVAVENQIAAIDPQECGNCDVRALAPTDGRRLECCDCCCEFWLCPACVSVDVDTRCNRRR
jgi:hypothetical protein